MTASSDQNSALAVDFADDQLVGTVRGQARVRVQLRDGEADAVLRLRRFLPRLTLLRYRDLAPDGSPVGPGRDAEALWSADPRQLDYAVALTPGAATREYRLEWELDPCDHPAIGRAGEELLLFRAYLLTRRDGGADQVREQRGVSIRWMEVDDVFHSWSTSPRAPESLREALKGLLREEAASLPLCELCRVRSELDLLLAQDKVWECSAAPELEEIRRLFVLRDLAGFPEGDRVAREFRTRHDHEDLSAALAAARERHKARLGGA